VAWGNGEGGEREKPGSQGKKTRGETKKGQGGMLLGSRKLWCGAKVKGTIVGTDERKKH